MHSKIDALVDVHVRDPHDQFLQVFEYHALIHFTFALSWKWICALATESIIYQNHVLEGEVQKGPCLSPPNQRMIFGDVDDSWSFSPVYALLQNLSISAESPTERVGNQQIEESVGNGYSSSHQHIDLDEKDYGAGLGNFDQLFTHLKLPLDGPPPTVIPDRECGPLFVHPNRDIPKEPKIVKWRDEVDGADLEDNDDADDSLNGPRKTKTQRKKANRKLRKAYAKETGSGIAIVTASSENESEKENNRERRVDRKKIIYQMAYGSSPPSDDSPIVRRMQVLKKSQQATNTEDWPVARPHASNGNHRTPATLGPSAYEIASAKKASLMKMLQDRFSDERQYLDSISLLPHTNGDAKAAPEGLHVFVDASNIMIGFHDALKATLSLTKEHRIPRQPFSFHHLSLLLTRGRPTSKLVLVGSDNFPAIAEAKSLGYETNILDRVHKVKTLTPRQKHFNKHGNKSEQSGGSGSETGIAAAFADKKWVEQAVDELLHLKMMESLVDVEEPGTMVVASGDAAEAEYSGGFLKMVERALVKGWKVEVACFRANTSGMYRRKEFREKWGTRFKLLEMDDFVHVLLGVRE